MTLTEFLLARFDERESEDDRFIEIWASGPASSAGSTFAEKMANRVKAPGRWGRLDLESKRRIVSEHAPIDPCEGTFGPAGSPCPTLRHLAAVYAAHPDYQEEWRL